MIWVEGVALVPTVRACGMWKEEEDGGPVWITSWIERPSSVKEGRRRGGGAESKE